MPIDMKKAQDALTAAQEHLNLLDTILNATTAEIETVSGAAQAIVADGVSVIQPTVADLIAAKRSLITSLAAQYDKLQRDYSAGLTQDLSAGRKLIAAMGDAAREIFVLEKNVK